MIRVTRRTFLSSAAAAAMLPAGLQASPRLLRAEQATLQILPDGYDPTPLWGFNGSTPGPEVRVRQGDTVNLRFENKTSQPSAIHWHGIRLTNAMDGVPGLTQPLVQPGDSFDYSFQAPDAGTYWYHSHHRSWEQVARGLYGPLIIEETDPPAVDADITITVDDWRIEESGALMDGFGNMHDFAHAGRLGNNAMILPSQGSVRLGDRVRLRVINTATARVFPLRFTGLNGKVVALDGMPLLAPRDLEDVQLAPAQRMDIIGDVTGAVAVLFLARDAAHEMGKIALSGENPAPATTDVPSLPAAAVAMPGATPDHTVRLAMEGGAMGGAHAGDDIWAFNGISGMAEQPLIRATRGETAVIELVNDTSFAHGIHLHGHHFHELDDAGGLADLRDTSLVARGSSRKIAVVLDNPGKWLLHCHMLGHQASGMKTWIEVI